MQAVLPDGEWALVASFPEGRHPVGLPRATSMRFIWDAIQYMAATGYQSIPDRALQSNVPKGADVAA